MKLMVFPDGGGSDAAEPALKRQRTDAGSEKTCELRGMRDGSDGSSSEDEDVTHSDDEEVAVPQSHQVELELQRTTTADSSYSEDEVASAAAGEPAQTTFTSDGDSDAGDRDQPEAITWSPNRPTRRAALKGKMKSKQMLEEKGPEEFTSNLW